MVAKTPDKKTPPIKPSIVLLGLTDGHNLFFPNLLPKNHAPVSVPKHKIKRRAKL